MSVNRIKLGFILPARHLAWVFLAVSGCAPRAPVGYMLKPECRVTVNRTDGMGTFARPRLYDDSGRYLSGEWAETYSGRGQERVLYDVQGRIVEVQAEHGDSSGCYDGMTFTATVRYDEQGRIVRLTTTNPYRTPRRQTSLYHYEHGGRLSEIQRDTARGSMTGRVLFTYEGNRLIRVEVHHANIFGEPWVGQGRFFYDGNRITRYHIRRCMSSHPEGKGCWEATHDFDYDEHGRLKMWSRTDGDTNRYGYDSQGRLASRTFIRDSREQPIGFAYDSQGRLLSVQIDGARKEYQYEGLCAPEMPEGTVFEPLGVLGFVPCVPTRVASCLSPDGRSVVRW
jgi:hypothetical protein